MNENQDLAKLTPEQRSQLMAQIKQKLQLPDDAEDFEVVARLAAIIGTLQQRYETAVQEQAQQKGEMANRDLEQFKDVINPADADYWHGLLMANREPTLKVLADMRERLAKAKPVTVPVPVPMRNRIVPVQPRTLGAPGEPSTDELRKAKAIGNRAATIQRDLNLEYLEAFNRAAAEFEAGYLK